MDSRLSNHTPITSKVSLPDVELSVTSVGRGEVGLLALHGGMGLDGSYFGGSALQQLGGDRFRVVWFDQRGHGASGQTGEASYTHQKWATDAIMLAERIGLTNYTLLGHSYGGYVALEAALRQPPGMSKLAIVDSRPGPIKEIQFNPSVEDDAALRSHYRSVWPQFFSGDDKHWEVFDRITCSRDAYMAAFTRELPAFDVSDRLANLALPTLLLAGDRPMFGEGMSRLHAGLPHAQMATIENSGHFPFIENRREFLLALRGFCSE